MIAPADLFVMDLNHLHEDLYRSGNASSPNFSEKRAFRDVTIRDEGGIKIVVADGNGYSASTMITRRMKAEGKNVWKIRKGTALPEGISLVKDLRDPTHFMFSPSKNMPLRKFLGLLEEVAINPLASVKLTPQEIRDAR